VHGIVAGLTTRAVACYADKTYISAGDAIGTPYNLPVQAVDVDEPVFCKLVGVVPAGTLRTGG
jgi:hypothetical protein